LVVGVEATFADRADRARTALRIQQRWSVTDGIDLSAIETLLAQPPEGARIGELEPRVDVPHRTLQSRLAALVRDAYRPNQTRYLDRSTTAELVALSPTREVGRDAGTFARRILDRLLIDLSWSSSRLERSMYSLLETEKLLAAGEQAEGKAAFEAQMILNHEAAVEFLLDNLLGESAAEGRLRRMPVRIEGSVFHPLETPQLIDEVFRQVLDTAAAITDPFEQSFFALVHLPYLQPFDDANKRVSRLAANLPLIRENLCPLSFLDVPMGLYVQGVLGVYELNRVDLLRDVYVWACRCSAQTYRAVRRALGGPDPLRLRYRVSPSEYAAWRDAQPGGDRTGRPGDRSEPGVVSPTGDMGSLHGD